MVVEITEPVGCGWCITGDHEQCHGWMKHYDTIWICGCKQPGCGAASARNQERIAKRAELQAQASGGEATVQPDATEAPSPVESGPSGEVVADGAQPKGRRRTTKPKDTTK